MLFFKNYNIEGAIFDIDGTLIDSLSQYLIYFNIGLEGIGVQPISKDVLFKYLGMGISLKDILRKILPDDKNDDQVVDKVAKEILDRFIEVDMEIQLLPGVMDVLEFFKAEEIKIGLATGRTSGVAYERKRLKTKNLDQYIDTIVTSDEVENRKPSPDVITKCAARLDVSINKCLAVGDSASDILAARNAGAIPVAVATGVEKRDKLKEQNPEALLETLGELIGLLERRPGTEKA